MMAIQFLLDRFAAAGADEAIVWRDRAFTYGWVSERVADWQRILAEQSVPAAQLWPSRPTFLPML